MAAIIIDGKAIAAACRAEVRAEVEKMERKPGLVVVIVGDHPASQVYVRNKHRACQEVGIRSEICALPGDTTEEELLGRIAQFNTDDNIDGILVQLPLPAQIRPEAVIEAIHPAKDVDAFHPINAGHIMIGDAHFQPCTPEGVMVLLQRSGITVEGKRCVVVGRSNIVGKPMAALLLQASGTVTICHSKTPDLAAVCREADILVSAVGRAGIITADMVKPGAAVMDVGMNRSADGKLCGDVDFDAVAQVAGYLTPVPGGVGPMTIAMLLRNTLRAAQGRCGTGH